MLLQKQLERNAVYRAVLCSAWAVREDALYDYAKPLVLFIMERLANLRYGATAQSKEGLAVLYYHIKPFIIAYG